MKTEVISIDINNLDLDKIKYAAGIIKSGGLVAFPTETVYGLGADALNQDAVKKIFKAKGRPSDNPLIAHVAHKSDVESLVKYIPKDAGRLMDKFWPGPLTIIMNKSDVVPPVISGGLDTIAVRMPSNAVALALIKYSGVSLAAPSANTSGRPSPTCASHVIEDLYGKVDVIIDAGRTTVGLESTVLDMTVTPPVILRPGAVTYSHLAGILGEVEINAAFIKEEEENLLPKSPGLKYTHYSPKADVIVVEGHLKKVADQINKIAKEHLQDGRKVGILATEQTAYLYTKGTVICLGDRNNPETIASNLFFALRELDRKNVKVILAESVENTDIGHAIMNRLNKASGYNIIKV